MGMPGVLQVPLLALAALSGGGEASRSMAPCAGVMDVELTRCVEKAVSGSTDLLQKNFDASRRLIADQPADLKPLETSQKLWEAFVCREGAREGANLFPRASRL